MVVIVRVVVYKLVDNSELHMSKGNYLPAALNFFPLIRESLKDL